VGSGEEKFVWTVDGENRVVKTAVTPAKSVTGEPRF
jgi:hypothetical protein